MQGQLDEDLYSRQIYVMGVESLQVLSKLNVLVVGMSGLGVEVAKNLILAGPRSVAVLDDTRASLMDTAHFYLTDAHVAAGTGRARAAHPRLAELNPYVTVELLERVEPSDALLARFDVVVACDTGGALAQRLDDYCHAHGKGFLFGEARGPFTRLFVDLGPSFVVRDTDGRAKEEYVVVGISNTCPPVVTVLAEEDRPLQRFIDTGSVVELLEVQGMAQANGVRGVAKLLSKCTLALLPEHEGDAPLDASQWGRYVTGGVVREVKQPRTMSFRPMREARTQHGEFQLEDWSKWGRAQQMHALFQALDTLTVLPSSAEEGPALAAAAAAHCPEPIDAQLAASVAALCRGSLSPVCAFLGGLMAQEALKWTGKFTPCAQWAYVDCLEVVPSPLPLDRQPRGDRFDGQRWVMGQALQERLGACKAFMVGAGALGCELLKGLACMGACLRDHEGSLVVTDMDSIEKSNLNRQFLFRDTDIGQPKSTVAARAAVAMNPRLNVRDMNIPVGVDTEHTFDATFWAGLDVAINALDTWAARLYVDSRCVEFRKPLLESGTLGATGHTQVVVPNVTLNFGATRVQKETTVPSCTIHHFPHTIHHTLTWAREQFDTLFVVTPEDLNRHTADPLYLGKLLERMPPAGKVEVLQRLLRTGKRARQPSIATLVREARAMFEQWFCAEIKQLLVTHPSDALDEDGGPFWAPPRRAPVPVEFDLANDLHVGFVAAATGLLCFCHNVPLARGSLDRARIASELGVAWTAPQIAMRDGRSDTELSASLARELGVGSVANSNIEPPLPSLRVAKFEKDDDANHHIDFLHCTSNLRAINYGITPIDRLEAKKIAGNIVPAMVTTTCTVTGLVLMQLYALLQNRTTIEGYREVNVDLATNLLAFCEPQPCVATRSTPQYRAVPESFTLWDTLEVSLGDCTVQKLGAWLTATHGCSLKAVSCEGMLLFRAADARTREERARSKVTAIYCQLKGIAEVPSHKYRLVLALTCVDKASGLPVEMPTVSFLLREPSSTGAAVDDQNTSKTKKKTKKTKKAKTDK